MEQDYDERTGHDFSTLWFMEGRQAYERGDMETALRLFEKSQDRSPHFKTKLFISRILAAMGRDQEAFEAIAAAYYLNDRHSETAVEYARALIARNRNAEAEVILQATIEHNRTYGPAKRALETLRQG